MAERGSRGRPADAGSDGYEEFRTPDWNPLILEVRDDYLRSLAACAVADVLLVNPIRTA